MPLLPPAPPRRPDPEPLEADDARVIAVGTALWLTALAVLTVLDLAGTRVPGWWLWMCVAGAGLGLLGVRFTRRRAAPSDRRPAGRP